jgi:glyoxylase-like metal-dependent hydrolase (beta-lactamase superfamily II)
MTISIGGAEIRRVEELQHRLPIAALRVDPALVAANAAWLSPAFLDPSDQTFPLVFQTWILRTDGLTVVVDPCNGNGRERPVFPFFHRLDTPFLERFEATGVRPDQVDVVFCTHLHCDHCGWNTRMQDGRWIPTFPNARYLFVRREVERWDPRRPGHRVIDYNVGVFEDSVQPILDAGLADLVEDRHPVSETLVIEPAYGHTGGHSTLRFAARGEELIFTGDAFHHPLQVLDPTLHLEGCDDLEAAVATRRRLRATLAERGGVMLPAHFPAPHGGRVSRHGEAFHFEPLGPAPARA